MDPKKSCKKGKEPKDEDPEKPDNKSRCVRERVKFEIDGKITGCSSCADNRCLSDRKKACKCDQHNTHQNPLSLRPSPGRGASQRPAAQNRNVVADLVDEAFSEDLNGAMRSSPVENGFGYVSDEDIDFSKLHDVSQDDMERYFQENVHMLQRHSSSGSDTPGRSPSNEVAHISFGGTSTDATDLGWQGTNVTCTYPSTGQGIVTDTGYSNVNGMTRNMASDTDSDEGGVYILPEDLVCPPKIQDKSEDEDFIESDMPRNRFSCSLDSSNSLSTSRSQNSISSSYEDLQTHNIQRPSSGDSNSLQVEDDETFTKLVFNKESRDQDDNKSEDTDDYVHPWTLNDSESDSYSLPVPRPTNLFDSHVHCCGNARKNVQEQPNNIATCISNSTSSSSPYTVSSAFISPQYSDNSNLYNGVTSESSVFMSPETSDSGSGSVSQRRQNFLRHQSMDYNADLVKTGGLRSARSSGDLPDRGLLKESLSQNGVLYHRVPCLIPKSHSHNICQLHRHQELDLTPTAIEEVVSASPGAQAAPQEAKECNVAAAHSTRDSSPVVEEASMRLLPVLSPSHERMRRPEGEETDTSSSSLSVGGSNAVMRMLSCAFCKRQRASVRSCDNNACERLRVTSCSSSLSTSSLPLTKCCSKKTCTCSVKYYFHWSDGVLNSSSFQSSRTGFGDGSSPLLFSPSHLHNHHNYHTGDSHSETLSCRSDSAVTSLGHRRFPGGRMHSNNLTNNLSYNSGQCTTVPVSPLVRRHNVRHQEAPISRQTSTSNCDYEENNMSTTSTSTSVVTVYNGSDSGSNVRSNSNTNTGCTPKVNGSANQVDSDATISPATPPRIRPYIRQPRENNLVQPAATGENGAQERRENENNTNIENGQLLQRLAIDSDTTEKKVTNNDRDEKRDDRHESPKSNKPHSNHSGSRMGMWDTRPRMHHHHNHHHRDRNPMGLLPPPDLRPENRRKGIKILPLLLRSGNSIDDMDPQAVMELFMQNEEDSEDDGYVDFHKMLKDYMEQKLYEKHSIASTWYSCEEESRLGAAEQTMIWTEYQAYLYHSRQIGVSACGATAIINVLKVFEIYPDEKRVCDVVKTNTRAERAQLPEYLLSRSLAGTSAEHLIESVKVLSHGAVYGKFFHMYPDREVCVRRWLSYWIQKDAVPLVTLNLQKAVPSGHIVPDAWHHQMVFGVGPQGVYLTNPQEIVPEYVMKQQLCSPAELLIRRKDVLSHWTDDCDLGVLMRQKDQRWRLMNVLGQVVNVLREEKMPHFPGFRPQLTSHISIPAWYRSGITLFIRKSNEAYKELRALPELSIRPPLSKHRRGRAKREMKA